MACCRRRDLVGTRQDVDAPVRRLGFVQRGGRLALIWFTTRPGQKWVTDVHLVCLSVMERSLCHLWLCRRCPAPPAPSAAPPAPAEPRLVRSLRRVSLETELTIFNDGTGYVCVFVFPPFPCPVSHFPKDYDQIPLFELQKNTTRYSFWQLVDLELLRLAF